jgi:hypothetical protein
MTARAYAFQMFFVKGGFVLSAFMISQLPPSLRGFWGLDNSMPHNRSALNVSH